jgi:hypothetical protein
MTVLRPIPKMMRPSSVKAPRHRSPATLNDGHPIGGTATHAVRDLRPSGTASAPSFRERGAPPWRNELIVVAIGRPGKEAIDRATPLEEITNLRSGAGRGQVACSRRRTPPPHARSAAPTRGAAFAGRCHRHAPPFLCGVPRVVDGDARLTDVAQARLDFFETA